MKPIVQFSPVSCYRTSSLLGPNISCSLLTFISTDEELDCCGYRNTANNNFLLQNKLVRKLFSDEPEGKKLNVPTPKVRVTVAKPTVPSSSSTTKQHKKTVRIVILYIYILGIHKRMARFQ
jgi:hypothetical protein